MELSPSRKARRQRCTLPGAELGRARQGWQERRGGGGPCTPTGDPANSGRAPLHDKQLSHSAERRRMEGAQPSAPAAPSIPAAEPHGGGRGQAEGGEERSPPR